MTQLAFHGPGVRATVVLLLATLGVVAPGARPAAADSAVPWTARPAANDFGASRPGFGYTIDPGARIEDGLVVVNHGASPVRLSLYAADGFTADTGTLALRAEGASSKGIGTWVRPGRDHVTLRAGEAVEVPFVVAVPKHAAPGDYMGGIVTSAPAGEVDAGRRVDIPIRLRVGGTLAPSLAVEDVHLGFSHTADPFAAGDATVTYTIHNTGNAILSARQSVSVSGPFGRWGVDAKAIRDTPALLPGDTWKVAVPVDGVHAALRLTAKVTLVPLLTDAAGSTSPLAATEGSGHAWAVQWALLAGAVLLVGLGVVGVVALRRRGWGSLA